MGKELEKGEATIRKIVKMISVRLKKVKVLVTQLCPTLCNPMDCSLPGFLSMEFSRQEYWSGVPFSSPGDLHPGVLQWRWILYLLSHQKISLTFSGLTSNMVIIIFNFTLENTVFRNLYLAFRDITITLVHKERRPRKKSHCGYSKDSHDTDKSVLCPI